MKHHAATRMLADGVELAAPPEPGPTTCAVSFSVETTEEQRAKWERLMLALSDMPAVLTRIDAPSTLVSELRAAIGREVVRHSEEWSIPLDVYDPSAVPIRIDQTLPMRTVRYHYSDGTTKQERLG